MSFDIANAAFEVSKALREVTAKQMLYQGLDTFIKTIRITWLSVNDLLVNIEWIFILEWWEACEHLINENT